MMPRKTFTSIALRVALASALGMGIVACPAATLDLEACYGLLDQENLTVHLVEFATETGGVYVVIEPEARLPSYDGIPSCAGFDGVVPGGRYTFSNVDLAGKVRGNQCSLPVADVNVPGRGVVMTASGHEADATYTDRGGGDVDWGPTTVAPNATVAGCSGTWIFGTFPFGIAIEHGDRQENQLWSSEYLFDQLTPGSTAPVLAMRHFRVAEGTNCPALPVGVAECADLFSGYFERHP